MKFLLTFICALIGGATGSLFMGMVLIGYSSFSGENIVISQFLVFTLVSLGGLIAHNAVGIFLHLLEETTYPSKKHIISDAFSFGIVLIIMFFPFYFIPLPIPLSILTVVHLSSSCVGGFLLLQKTKPNLLPSILGSTMTLLHSTVVFTIFQQSHIINIAGLFILPFLWGVLVAYTSFFERIIDTIFSKEV